MQEEANARDTGHIIHTHIHTFFCSTDKDGRFLLRLAICTPITMIRRERGRQLSQAEPIVFFLLTISHSHGGTPGAKTPELG